jgi:hypothetical protein
MLGGKLMFGHQDDQEDHNNQETTDVVGTPSQVLTDDQTSPTDNHLNDGDDQTSPTDDSNETNVVADNNPANDLLPASAEDSSTDELLAIKQHALSQLSPIVNHLDQTPEEKFRTTMMMIQASDDQTLIKTAYAAAQQIEDEKQKAQALLDIVNEINYFTHPSKDN